MIAQATLVLHALLDGVQSMVVVLVHFLHGQVYSFSQYRDYVSQLLLYFPRLEGRGKSLAIPSDSQWWSMAVNPMLTKFMDPTHHQTSNRQTEPDAIETVCLKNVNTTHGTLSNKFNYKLVNSGKKRKFHSIQIIGVE